MKQVDRRAGARAHDGSHRFIDEAEALFTSIGRNRSEISSLITGARAQASALAPAAGESTEGARFGALIFAAEVVAGLTLHAEWPRQEIQTIMARLSKIIELPPEVTTLGVYLRVIRDPRLVGLPPWLGVETNLRTLFAFAPVNTVSLWRTGPLEPLQCILSLGSAQPTRRMRAAAAAAVHGVESGNGSGKGSIRAVALKRWQHVYGALVVRARPRDCDRALAFVQEAGITLGLVLERETLLERGAARERSLVESSERRLTRLSFDLHDGPLQDVGAATRELRLFRQQLAHALPPDENYDLVFGRLDDLEEILLTSEIELRELAQSADSPVILKRPFREIIEGEIRAFASCTDITVNMDLRGDFESLTASQRIALIRIFQEALTNVREHSGASEVRVSIVRTRDRVHAEVADNGRGFEVERTVVQAARRGRLGLVGMSERVRLLGGTLDVRSRPGDSTIVSVTLPEWRPLSVKQPREAFEAFA